MQESNSMRKRIEKFGAFGKWDKREMNIKLLNVSEETRSKYEVRFERDGKLKTILITEDCHLVENADDYLSVITSENQEFYEIWANFNFRKSVSQAIRQIKDSKVAELQAV